MYRVKEEKKKETELRFRPYRFLGDDGVSPDQRVSAIQGLIAAGKYEEAIEESDALIGIALEGLRYLQTYDWLFLRALITVGYLGWMAYAITSVIDTFVLHESIAPKRTAGGLAAFSSILVALYASFLVSKSPLTYYAYAFFPVVFWEEVYAHRDSLILGRKALFGHIASAGAVATLVGHAVLSVAIVQCLVGLASVLTPTWFQHLTQHRRSATSIAKSSRGFSSWRRRGRQHTASYFCGSTRG